MYDMYLMNIANECTLPVNMLQILSNERRQRIYRYRFDIDKIRSCYAEILLRYSLYDHYRIIDVCIKRDANGKPYLADTDTIHFNISHAGDWVVCVLGETAVGVDVERVQQMGMDFVTMTYTSVESTAIKQITDEIQRDKAAIQLWTIKESYIKAIGLGLKMMPNQYRVKRYGEFYGIEGEDQYLIQCSQLDFDHYYAVCGQAREFGIRQKFVNRDILQSWIEGCL